MGYSRNEFNFWSVHGIMNTSVSCEVNVKPFGSHVSIARDPKYIPRIELIAYIFKFYYKYLKYIIFNLGIKTVLYLKYN